MFLTVKELRELTHHVRRDAQVRVLRKMGIPHLIHPDGRPLVSQNYIDSLFGDKKSKAKESEPNWDGLNAEKKTA